MSTFPIRLALAAVSTAAVLALGAGPALAAPATADVGVTLGGASAGVSVVGGEFAPGVLGGQVVGGVDIPGVFTVYPGVAVAPGNPGNDVVVQNVLEVGGTQVGPVFPVIIP